MRRQGACLLGHIPYLPSSCIQLMDKLPGFKKINQVTLLASKHGDIPGKVQIAGKWQFLLFTSPGRPEVNFGSDFITREQLAEYLSSNGTHFSGHLPTGILSKATPPPG